METCRKLYEDPSSTELQSDSHRDIVIDPVLSATTTSCFCLGRPNAVVFFKDESRVTVQKNGPTNAYNHGVTYLSLSP